MSLEKFTQYLLLEKKYSQLTVTAYHKDISDFFTFSKEEFEISKPSKVNYSIIRSWIVTLVESGISNRTINRKISSLNTFFKFLQKVEDVKSNPLANHRALKVSKKVQIPFSESEINIVLDEFNYENDFESVRNLLIVELFYSTGIRRDELVNLKIKNVDIDSNTIKVLGKRNKERIIPLLNTVTQRIKVYLSYRNKLEIIKDKEFLFLTKKGVKTYGTLVYRIINEYFSKASAKVKKSPHILRHSFATHLLNQGADINAVKELLGHTSLAATQVYTHSSIAELKKVYENTHPRSKP